jgi:hypothetical protein
MKQLAPEDTLLPHVLLSAKSFASVPVIEMPVIVTVELPLFVIVIVLARLLVPTGYVEAVGIVIGKKTTFDAAPGSGFTT